MEQKLKFAVFIDYDNIEIGVKSTLHREFDVDIVLEGLKERGEVVAKISYGNWSRHGAAARALSEHGVQMVQRDSTPRGDKNGADINLALDALEMAFTRDHINAFAIVSGDSDFMALVNKLKQFNKRVYIVGGKAFTSTILQKNCHEFISYESLLDSQPSHGRRGGQPVQRSRPRRSLPLTQAIPLIDRALHALELRGVQPQLGLLKSTMLQLDPAFTERDYGTSSFSTFVEKLVDQNFLSVQTVDGHYVVDRKAQDKDLEADTTATGEDAIPLLKEVLTANIDLLAMGIPAREVRALVRAADPSFKETDYGFSEFAELLNLAGDKGLVRVEPDPHHGFRYYPGDELPHPAQVVSVGSEAAEAASPESKEETAAQAETAEETADTASSASRRSKTRRRRRRTGESAKQAANAAPAGEESQPAGSEEETAAAQPKAKEKSETAAAQQAAAARATRSRRRRSSASSRRKQASAEQEETAPAPAAVE